jgi:hypothetical protein
MRIKSANRAIFRRITLRLDQATLNALNETGQEMGFSKSKVIRVAIEEHLRRRRNRKLQQQIDAALGDDLLTDDDRAFLDFSRRMMREIIERDEFDG